MSLSMHVLSGFLIHDGKCLHQPSTLCHPAPLPPRPRRSEMRWRPRASQHRASETSTSYTTQHQSLRCLG
jgi:hypothetical protein